MRMSARVCASVGRRRSYGTMAEFNRVQNETRAQQLRAFFTAHVAADDRKLLLTALTKDFADLGLVFSFQ